MPGNSPQLPSLAVVTSDHSTAIRQDHDLHTIGDLHGDAMRALTLTSSIYNFSLNEDSMRRIKQHTDESQNIISQKLNSLIQNGRVDQYYTWFRAILDKDAETWTEEEQRLYSAVTGEQEIQEFAETIAADPQVQKKNKVIFIGDMLADRQTNSLLMLKLFEGLHNRGEEFTIIYSNHDLVFMKAYKIIKECLDSYQKKGFSVTDYNQIKAQILDPMWSVIMAEAGGQQYSDANTNHQFLYSFYSLASFGFTLEKMVFDAHQNNEPSLLKPLLQLDKLIQDTYLPNLKMAELNYLSSNNPSESLSYVMTHAPQALMNKSDAQNIFNQFEELLNADYKLSLSDLTSIFRLLKEFVPKGIYDSNLSHITTYLNLAHRDVDQEAKELRKIYLSDIEKNYNDAVAEYRLETNPEQKTIIRQNINSLKQEYEYIENCDNKEMYRIQITSLLREFTNVVWQDTNQSTSILHLWSKIDETGDPNNYKYTIQRIMSQNIAGNLTDAQISEFQEQLEDVLNKMIDDINNFIRIHPEALYDENHLLYETIFDFCWNRTEIVGVSRDFIKVTNVFGHQGTSKLDGLIGGSNPDRTISLDLTSSKYPEMKAMRCLLSGKRFRAYDAAFSLSLPESMFDGKKSSTSKKRPSVDSADDQSPRKSSTSSRKSSSSDLLSAKRVPLADVSNTPPSSRRSSLSTLAINGSIEKGDVNGSNDATELCDRLPSVLGSPVRSGDNHTRAAMVI